MVGMPYFLQISWKMLSFMVHSVVSLNTLEASSASKFSTPGICAALTHISCFIAWSHICLAISFWAFDLVDPCLLMQATAVVLSVIILTWFGCLPLVRESNENHIALSSSVLMCSVCSPKSHLPPVFFICLGVKATPTFVAGICVYYIIRFGWSYGGWHCFQIFSKPFKVILGLVWETHVCMEVELIASQGGILFHLHVFCEKCCMFICRTCCVYFANYPG